MTVHLLLARMENLVSQIVLYNKYVYGHILLILIVTDGCPEETDVDFGIHWPSTMINMKAKNACPNGIGMVKFSNI